jgi:phospholipid/cholesterol/gamma-HCH transport system ATP-binding protein
MTEPINPETAAIAMRGVEVSSLQDGDQVVLHDVDWTVGAGEYWVIGGMQGSGKSDLLAMTAGLMPPHAGSYQLFGQPMPIFEEERLAARLRVGLVFDGGQLLHNLTIGENLALPLRYHREDGEPGVNERVAAMLELVGLPDFANRTPGSLGRNLHKRIGLARALMLQPEVLLLDTPLAGLDLRQMNWWLNFLGQLSTGHPCLGGRRLTLVATAGDLRPWRERATHFALLQDQRFVMLGGGDTLRGHVEPLVRELMAEPAQTPA